MSITGGKGADVILDFDRRLGYGTKALLAWPRGGASSPLAGRAGTAGQIPTDLLHAGNKSAIGYSTGGHRYERPEVLRPAGDAVLGYLRSKQLKMVVSARFPLGEANAALDLVASRKSTGRVVLTNS